MWAQGRDGKGKSMGNAAPGSGRELPHTFRTPATLSPAMLLTTLLTAPSPAVLTCATQPPALPLQPHSNCDVHGTGLTSSCGRAVSFSRPEPVRRYARNSRCCREQHQSSKRHGRRVCKAPVLGHSAGMCAGPNSPCCGKRSSTIAKICQGYTKNHVMKNHEEPFSSTMGSKVRAGICHKAPVQGRSVGACDVPPFW